MNTKEVEVFLKSKNSTQEKLLFLVLQSLLNTMTVNSLTIVGSTGRQKVKYMQIICHNFLQGSFYQRGINL